VAQRREERSAAQPDLDPDRLVFLDETWAKTNMTRTRGRSPRGTRLVARVPHGHWKTTTFVAGLRTTGLTAPLVVDGAINSAVFLADVRQQLAPALHPVDVVVMDNLGAHKVAGARKAIEAAGARVAYLPPYSPDLNRSRRRSRNSRGCCDRPGSGPSSRSGRHAAGSATHSRNRNAGTTSATADTATPK
jgi:hypothetical protein